MNLQEALIDIKKVKGVTYFDSIFSEGDRIRIDVTFKNIETAKKFASAWAMSIRQRTDQVFIFFLSYFSLEGKLKPLVISYKPHRVSRGFDFESKGHSRSGNNNRRITLL